MDDLQDVVRQFLEHDAELFGEEAYNRTLYERLVQHVHEKRRSPIDSSRITPERFQGTTSLRQLYESIRTCRNCPLGESRTNFVFGVGNPNADIVLVGEAPGAEEDRKGEPFVGRAGKLLNQILESVNFKREDVYICNILKCRPPNNRDPLPAEVSACEPYLHHQLDLINPKIIVALGRVAAQTLLRTKESLTRLRTRVHSYHNIPMVVTYHPAALLRNPNWKRPTWEDFKKLREMHDNLNTAG
ncbi:MAG: uracil-DNA glycosylase [Chlorobi bacterium]|nr:uracil-DNA glycosylase [Chlorobiota bacterium]